MRRPCPCGATSPPATDGRSSLSTRPVPVAARPVGARRGRGNPGALTDEACGALEERLSDRTPDRRNDMRASIMAVSLFGLVALGGRAEAAQDLDSPKA